MKQVRFTPIRDILGYVDGRWTDILTYGREYTGTVREDGRVEAYNRELKRRVTVESSNIFVLYAKKKVPKNYEKICYFAQI